MGLRKKLSGAMASEVALSGVSGPQTDSCLEATAGAGSRKGA